MYAFRPQRLVRPLGFTLIELLIVVGIIALLLGILMPMVGKVRESGRTAVCMSNLRQVGTAATGYSTKYGGFLVPGYANPAVLANNETADAENYATILVNEKLLDAPAIDVAGAPIAERDSVFRCPDGYDTPLISEFSAGGNPPPMPKDRKAFENFQPLRTKSMRSGKYIDTWYGINLTIADFDTRKQPYRRVPASPKATDYRLVNMSELKDSSRTVFLYDGTFFDLHYNANRIGARHNNQTLTNILFSDGHVEAVPTVTLPGGLGPVTISSDASKDIFSKANLGDHPTYIWRLDQK